MPPFDHLQAREMIRSSRVIPPSASSSPRAGLHHLHDVLRQPVRMVGNHTAIASVSGGAAQLDDLEGDCFAAAARRRCGAVVVVVVVVVADDDVAVRQAAEDRSSWRASSFLSTPTPSQERLSRLRMRVVTRRCEPLPALRQLRAVN